MLKKIQSATASAGTPASAIDFNTSTGWSAGATTGYIEFNLGSQISLGASGFWILPLTTCTQTLVVYAGAATNPTTQIFSGSLSLTSGVWTQIPVSALTGVQYVRLQCTASTVTFGVYEALVYDATPTNYVCQSVTGKTNPTVTKSYLLQTVQSRSNLYKLTKTFKMQLVADRSQTGTKQRQFWPK
jgi:hypothetical protein